MDNKQENRVEIVGLKGKRHLVNLNSQVTMKSITVEELFGKVSILTGITAEEMRLIFKGKDLQIKNARGLLLTLGDYSILAYSTITLIAKLQGGER